MKSRKPAVIGLMMMVFVASLSAAAPHPSCLQLQVGDQLLPVVGMKGSDPILWVDGKEKRNQQVSELKYDVARAERYADATVEVSEMLGGGGESIASVDLSLVASETLKGAYAVIVIFNGDFLTTSPYSDVQYLVRPLPDLPAGKKVKVYLIDRSFVPKPRKNKEGTNSPPEQRFFPLIFAAGGYEVRSNESRVAAAYFQRMNLVKHAAVLAAYRQKYSQTDHPVAPLFSIPPLLPTKTHPAGKTAMATLSVSSEGRVEAIGLDEDLDPPVATAFREALADWLFLPRLKAGVPVPSKVQLPLQY